MRTTNSPANSAGVQLKLMTIIGAPALFFFNVGADNEKEQEDKVRIHHRRPPRGLSANSCVGIESRLPTPVAWRLVLSETRERQSQQRSIIRSFRPSQSGTNRKKAGHRAADRGSNLYTCQLAGQMSRNVVIIVPAALKSLI